MRGVSLATGQPWVALPRDTKASGHIPGIVVKRWACPRGPQAAHGDSSCLAQRPPPVVTAFIKDEDAHLTPRRSSGGTDTFNLR